MAIFIECLLPQCKCAALQIKPDKKEALSLNVTSSTSQNISVHFVAPPVNYSLLDQCDRECHSECMTIKKFVPASIVVGCTRGKCGCFYDVARTIQE